MRVLRPAEGFPALPPVQIGLVRNRHEPTALTAALHTHIVQSLDNLAGHSEAAE
jgi:hypothetical protein